ncbi:MAG: phospho-N-acetylmuramoyl-pentapeptide-transferase [Chloroflexi bacterium]|nr:MAG: phospho-N-acetylmuramoyl-pentapeptide-transferase [Chloroflexota bacterium]
MGFALALSSLSFLLAVVWGGPLIRWLREHRIGKQIRINGPSTHRVKMGTPTMGGLLIVIPVLLITAALNVANLLGRTIIGRSILVPMGVMLSFALLGAVDDYLGVRGYRHGESLPARWKFPIQIGLALATALALHFGLGYRRVALPGVPQSIDIGLSYVPIATFIIVGTANAVNLTDGLDGLAGIIVGSAFVAYGVIAFLQGWTYLARFSFTVVGACFAFLWYNAHPAELFMGDTGSLALGATLAVVALMSGQWLVLPVVAIIPVAEALSVILQVAYFKWTGGKRLFKMSPLHHHFELLGWSETQVVQRFWLVGLMSAMLGVALAIL